jgi:hypothetical protein
MKILKTFFILLSFYFAFFEAQHSFKRLKCKSFDENLIRINNCSLNENILNLVVTLLKDARKPFYVHVVMAKKTKENFYQDYFRTELIEVRKNFIEEI